MTDLPQPLSPTTPRVRPRGISRSTPSTARTMPSSRKNLVWRPWMEIKESVNKLSPVYLE